MIREVPEVSDAGNGLGWMKVMSDDNDNDEL